MATAQWLGSPSESHFEVRVPTGGLAVVLIADAPAHKRDTAHSRLTYLTSVLGNIGEAILQCGPFDKWMLSSGLQRQQLAQVRLIGGHQELAIATKWVAASGIQLGRPVEITAGMLPLFFFPSEGRLKILGNEGQAQSSAAVMTNALAPSTHGRKIRVLVVDDSKTVCDLLARIIGMDAGMECVGTVYRPSLVEQAVIDLKPDVITLDIHMEEMSGVEVVRKIFPIFKIPIIMISSISREQGNVVFDALFAGAVDYIQKPSIRDVSALGNTICEKIRAAATARVGAVGGVGLTTRMEADAVDMDYIIGIGSSTGGVEALRDVFVALPENIPPILVVQHIPPAFSKAFAERMDVLCPFVVKEAENGEEVRPNHVYIAPGGMQMEVKATSIIGLKICVADAPPMNRHKPSVDYLFDSIVTAKRRKVAACVLTGMGADGAAGLLKLRQNGARTLAQDEASCVVYGMPREAAKLGAAEEVVPLGSVARTLMRFCKKGQRAPYAARIG